MHQDLDYLRGVAQSCVDENPGDPEADMVVCGCDLLEIIEDNDKLIKVAKMAQGVLLTKGGSNPCNANEGKDREDFIKATVALAEAMLELPPDVKRRVFE